MTTATKPTLFSLTEDMAALDAALTESGGEVTPEIAPMLELVSAELETKVDGLGWFIRTCEARAAGFKRAAEDLAAKRLTEENKVAGLKQYVRACMDMRHVRSLEGEVYTFAIQKNGGKPPVRLLVEDVDRYPADCVKVVTSINREAVRAFLEAGHLAEGLAMIEPVGEHVRLR